MSISPAKSTNAATSSAVLQSQPFHRSFQRYLGILTVLVVCGLYFLLQEEHVIQEEDTSERKIPLAQCPAFCLARTEQLKRHFGGNLLNASFLVETVAHARDRFHASLKEDYGDTAFTAMWVDPNTKKVLGDRICNSANRGAVGDASYLKFRRKLQLKILQVQMSLLDERKNLEGCDCTAGTLSGSDSTVGRNRGRHRQLQPHQLVLPEILPHYQRFVWATGGHSAAASHGNLYNESYTAFMTNGVKGIFQSLGMEFIGRNYAMGGMDSAPLLALCNEAVFGKDADVISWDFGMTDGGAHWKTTLYANRIGVHSNRPAHVSINVEGRQYKKRAEALALAEQDGVPTLVLHPETQDLIYKNIPDCFGMPQEEVDKIGPFARYFKCKGAIEKEDPCGAHKYNDDICPKRKFKASWHPGWRQHALTGNMLALFLTEAMVDAVNGLNDLKDYDPHTQYAVLKAEEDAEYDAFRNTTVPAMTTDFISDELVNAGMKSQYLFRNKAVCKTALLPAQTRYLGILTESDKIGEIHGFDVGLESEFAKKQPPISEKDNGDLTLAYEIKDHQQCEVDLNVDYKDFFYATQDWGWASIKFPNDAEIREYADDKFDPIGIILLCFHKCDWGKCPASEVTEEGFKEGKWKMLLNGEPVSEITKADYCFLVRTKDGYYHKPNHDGRYELKVRTGEPGEDTFVRISSIIVL